jgi:hypothetical protein
MRLRSLRLNPNAIVAATPTIGKVPGQKAPRNSGKYLR